MKKLIYIFLGGLLLAQASPAVAQSTLLNGSRSLPFVNDTVTGTAQNKLAKLNSAGTAAVTVSTADTQGVIGICDTNCATSGVSYVANYGIQPCVFDGGTTAGDTVTISIASAGSCHDTGGQNAPPGQCVGRVLSTHTNAGTYQIKFGCDLPNNASAADAWLAAETVLQNMGKFTDTGSLSAWPVEYAQVGTCSVLDSVNLYVQNPWVNCTSAATVTVVDDLGNTLTTFNTQTDYSTGSSVYSYMAGVKQTVNAQVASGATFLIPQFTSPASCSQYATKIGINLHTHQILVSLSPWLNASVAESATLQFTATVTGSTITNDSTVSWTVDGIAGGNSTVGTISSGGLYTAPATAGTHSVGAISNACTPSASYTRVTVTVTPS